MKQFNKKSARVLALSFLLAFFSLVIIYALYGFAPFGDKSLLIMDMNEQYSAFYNSLYNLSNEANPLFSWNKSMGTENVSLFSYYLSSPFNFLILLFKPENLHYGIFFINAFKVGCIALSLSLFLSNRLKKWEYSFILFSLSYVLMSYVLDYSMCLMWLDGVIWLPIVLIGIDRILEDKSPSVLIFSFLTLVLSNYYTAYMVYVFAIIYFFYRIFIEDAIEKKLIFKKVLTCAISSVLVAGMSMFLMLPSFLYLLEGRLEISVGHSNGFLYSLDNLLPNFLSGYYDSITNSGTASVYTSLLMIVLLISFFINKNIKLKEKISAGILIVFFILSFNFSPLVTFWHLFSFPSWFPARHAFVFGFFIIYLGAKSFYSVKKSDLLIALLISLLLAFISHHFFDLGVISIFNLMIVVGYIIAILILKNKKLLHISFGIILIIELIFNGYYQVMGLDNQFRYVLENDYSSYYASLNPVIEKMNEDESFYRAEKDFERNKNDAIEFNYKGITHYSSAFKAEINSTLRTLGNPQSYFWNSYYGKNPVLNALFSVKYEINKGDAPSFYMPEFSNEDITLYENPYTIPLIAYANGDINTQLNSNPFENSEQILKSIYSYDGSVFNVQSLNLISHTGEKIGENQFKSEENINLEYLNVIQETGDIYLNLTCYNRYTLYINGEEFKTACEHYANEGTVYIGRFNQGDILSITLNFYDKEINLQSAFIAIVNEELLKSVTDEINKNTQNLIINGTDISADIMASENGFLYTSIPYDKGWSISVNGEKIETQKYLDTFLSIPLNAGENFVELSFSPIGFNEGVIISSVFIILTAWYLKRKVF